MFADEEAILFDDSEHSAEEERFLLLRMSDQAKVLIVCHCCCGANGIIRIISARKATNTERKQYVEINRGWC